MRRIETFVDDLARQIMELEVNIERPHSATVFKDLWLELFWLSSNLCRYERGSSQYTQNSTNELCIRKGLPVAICRKEHPQLNTLAITLPLEDFKRIADESLEPWLPGVERIDSRARSSS